jgi:hypothetical protein
MAKGKGPVAGSVGKGTRPTSNGRPAPPRPGWGGK